MKFITSDKIEVEVPGDIAVKSGIVSRMMDSMDADDVVVPLENVTAETMSRVVKYMETDKFEAPETNDDLLALVIAANFLDINELLDATCQAVADRIKGKSPEQIREIFGLENTYTPEEEAKVRQANAWAYE